MASAGYDATVYGAGIFGLACAWACQRRGARVQVIDPGGPGAGASGGIVGALAPHVPETWNAKKAFQLDSLLMAATYWEGVRTAGGVDPGYARLGRLQPLSDSAAVDRARARAAGAAELWQGRAVWDVVPADTAAGWCPETPTGVLIHDTLSARIHPRRACAALTAALRARGGVIAADGRASGAILHATGWRGLEDMSIGAVRTAGTGVKGQAALLAHDARDRPQLFCDGVHIVPHADGTTAVGSTSERDFTDPTSTDAALEAVIAAARRAVPALADAPVLETWAGVRPRARSRAPILGPWPGRPGHFIANGGFKIGFGMAPKVGDVMADLILEGRDAIPEGFQVDSAIGRTG